MGRVPLPETEEQLCRERPETDGPDQTGENICREKNRRERGNIISVEREERERLD